MTSDETINFRTEHRTAPQKTVLIVDFSNLAYSSFYAAIYRDGISLENVKPDYRGHLATFRSQLSHLLTESKASRVIFALDQHPESKHRVLPGYKAKRKPKLFDPKHLLMQEIQTMIEGLYILSNFSGLEIQTCQATGEEADDVIATLALLYHESESVFVASCDKDLWAILVLPNVRVFNFQTRTYASQKLLQEKFGIDKFEHISLVKSLFGDASDNIINLLPRSQAQLLPVINASDGTLESFLRELEAVSLRVSSKCRAAVLEKTPDLYIHYEVIALHFGLDLIFSGQPKASETG